MAQRHAYSQPIEIYSLAPHNRNIWPSPTPTANQYKHMAQRRIIETYGHTIAGRRSFVCASGRFFCLAWCLYSNHYSCTYIHTYMYIHIYIHVHTYIHTFIHSFITWIYIAPFQDYYSGALPTLVSSTAKKTMQPTLTQPLGIRRKIMRENSF